jgi:DNA-binding HxlR family transcriptional regulator
VLQRTYEGQVCSVARTLELIGERWTVLILRDVFRGNRRFDQMQESLGIARNVLAKRLEHLCEEDILERRRYQERPERFEYRLTEKGIDLWPVLMQMMMWGDKHLSGGAPPAYVEHRDCGGQPDEHLICDRCGEPLHARNVSRRPGPGLKIAA